MTEDDDLGPAVALVGAVAGVATLATMLVTRNDSFAKFILKSVGAGLVAGLSVLAVVAGTAVVLDGSEM